MTTRTSILRIFTTLTRSSPNGYRYSSSGAAAVQEMDRPVPVGRGVAHEEMSSLRPLSSASMSVQINKNPSVLPPLEKLVWGHQFTDHSLHCAWDDTVGWHDPAITPFGPLKMHPASSSLHYGIQCFEGLKAYANPNGKTVLFRPRMNLDRLRTSCYHISLPDFDSEELLTMMKKLISIDRRFIPEKEGYSLYVRPLAYSTQPSLGVAEPHSSQISVILSPVGPYFPQGFKPSRLYSTINRVRAFPRGLGFCKIGGNYSPTIRPLKEAVSKGFSQVLWLFPEDGDFLMTEGGTMNLFVRWINDQGVEELATPDLDEGLILPGVTRDSVLQLAKSRGDIEVKERKIYMIKDFMPALQQKRVLEVFATGTAALVNAIERIHFNGVDYVIPVHPEDPSAGIGPLGHWLLSELSEIQHGRREHEWAEIF